jgi:hypothetical protein
MVDRGIMKKDLKIYKNTPKNADKPSAVLEAKYK